jgi:tetratricopeptide (TPR) repeat protein
LLRALVAVLIVAIVVVAAALVRQLVVGSGGAPRTELERAVAAAEEAVRGNPNDPQARVKLAAAYLEQGSANSAIKQAQNAIRLAPKDPSGYYILGLAEGKSGDSKSAVADLRKAGTMEGQQAGFYQDAYVALAHEQEKAGDLKGAKASLDKAIDYGPENALLLYERGAFAERQNDWYTAALDYGWALQYVPTYQVAQDGLARVKKDHPAEAKKAAADLSTDARFNAPAVSATGTK